MCCSARCGNAARERGSAGAYCVAPASGVRLIGVKGQGASVWTTSCLEISHGSGQCRERTGIVRLVWATRFGMRLAASRCPTSVCRWGRGIRHELQAKLSRYTTFPSYPPAFIHMKWSQSHVELANGINIYCVIRFFTLLPYCRQARRIGYCALPLPLSFSHSRRVCTSVPLSIRVVALHCAA